MFSYSSKFKYLPVSQIDIDWGIYVTGSGYACVPPLTSYPNDKHPTGYQFDWSHGRILHEYQLVYITHGSGEFESKATGKIEIKTGDVIMLFPGVWHRYKPNKKTGWEEHWVSYNGDFPKRFVDNGFFNSNHPVLNPGYNVLIYDLYREILSAMQNEQIGFQQLIATLTMEILARLRTAVLAKNAGGKDVEAIIARARRILVHQTEKTVDIKALALQLDISYSWFRRMFKHYTGMPPRKFHQQIRINRAKELLTNRNMSLKTIAYKLGFESEYYFMVLFKKITKKTPSQWRNFSRKK